MLRSIDSIYDIIMHLAVGTDEINDEDSLANIGFDSLKIVELIIMLEDTFGIQFDDSALDPNQLLFVRDITHLVMEHMDMDEECK